MTKIRSSGILILAVSMWLFNGCAEVRTAAPLPPAKTLQPADLASLAGAWHGVLRGSGGGAAASTGRSAIGTVTLAPDGSYTTNVSGLPGAGKAWIEGGRVVFEGSGTRGTATLHEDGNRRVLLGEGTWVGFNGKSEFELTKR